MGTCAAREGKATPARRWIRVLLLVGGIALTQFILYGPSLLGQRILLPLDILTQPNVLLPVPPERVGEAPHDIVRSDLILQFEPERRFMAAELHAGRLPSWLPYQYAGVPLVWPRFSPFILLSCLTASPVILAWAQLAAALVAGVGAYLFFRRTLGVTFWAATIPAWCYPMTGFFIFWQGFPTGGAVYWFPWLLLAVDVAVSRPRALSVAALGLVSALVLVSGHIDVGGQTLLASGLFAIWRLGSRRFGAGSEPAFWRPLATVVLGWTLGFMLASPQVLPLLDYARTGARMERRAAGEEERPPGDWSSLPQLAQPDMNGAMRAGSLWLAGGNPLESSAAGYAGVIAMLVVAPLAWCSRRHRSFNALFVLLAVLGISWCVNLPGVVAILRLPGLNMMSHNRLVFWTALAVLAEAAIGLDALQAGLVRRHAWFALPIAALAALLIANARRAAVLPAALGSRIAALVQHGRPVGWIHDLASVRQLEAWFVRANLVAAVLCGLGLAVWALLLLLPSLRRVWLIAALGVLLVGDLLWFAYGRSDQSDPALYFPKIPALAEVARGAEGRVVGYSCLPAALAETQGLRDIRGYDSIDPGRLTELLALAADPRSVRNPYALVQWFTPRLALSSANTIRLPPVLDLLDVRTVIFRGSPPPGVPLAARSPDYWALTNPSAVGRVFIPRRTEIVPNDRERLARLASPQFDPREVAYLEEPVVTAIPAEGAAVVTSDLPTRIHLSLRMKTAGLVVLTDRWDAGWRAYLDGRPTPILRVDHALRGVIAPRGDAQLEFRYEPASFSLGLGVAGTGLAGILLFLILERKRRGRAAAGSC